MSRVSPAASAAVIGKLKDAGMMRSGEIAYRVFTSGFDVFPGDGCLIVVWLGDDNDTRGPMVSRAAEVLAADYDVQHRFGPATAIGGVEEQPHLEVRSDRWGR